MRTKAPDMAAVERRMKSSRWWAGVEQVVDKKEAVEVLSSVSDGESDEEQAMAMATETRSERKANSAAIATGINRRGIFMVMVMASVWCHM